MQDRKMVFARLGVLCVLALSGRFVSAQEKAAPSTAQVHVVITDMALRSDSEVPRLKPEEVKVKQGKTFLQVTQLIPAQGDNAALQLMILIDDTLNTQAIGNNLNDVKEFIKAQPPSTVVAVGHMSNATVNMLQNFTADHEQAIKAIRLPRGGVSAMGSPYLSLISVVKGWPQQNVRREVLMVSDGIDRLRGEKPTAAQHQYYLVFLATPKKKAGFQRVNIQTEVDNAEILAPTTYGCPQPSDSSSSDSSEAALIHG